MPEILDSAAVPSLEEVTTQLMSGLPGDAGAATPPPAAEPAPAAAAGGFRFVEPEVPSAPATPPVDGAALQARIEELARELQTTRQTASESQGRVQTADQQRQLAETVAGAIAAQRQQELALYQAAAAAQPPQFANPDEILADGRSVLGAIQRYAQWNEARLMAQLGPYAQLISALHATVQAQSGLTRRMARSEAKRMAEEQLGAKDFDDVWGEVEQTLSGPAGDQMRLDPEQLFRAYALVKLNRGGNPLTPPRASTPPPSADPRPSVRTVDEGTRARLAHLAPMARSVARTLGLGDDIAVSLADLQRVGLAP